MLLTLVLSIPSILRIQQPVCSLIFNLCYLKPALYFKQKGSDNIILDISGSNSIKAYLFHFVKLKFFLDFVGTADRETPKNRVRN